MEKITIKIKREDFPKPRILANKIKPEQIHKSKKEYDRKKEKQKLKERMKQKRYED